MEQKLKEIKIILYILVVMVGMQMGFTFNKLNMIEDDVEAITITTASKDVYLIETDSSGDTLWTKWPIRNKRGAHIVALFFDI